MVQVGGSIVLYENDASQVLKTIHSFLSTSLAVKLFLIDNSPTDTLRKLSDHDERISYFHVGNNLGYGTAHNIAIRQSIAQGILYHVVLNPDVYFDGSVVEKLYQYMEESSEVGQVMPLIKYPDESLQYLCKLLPTPLDLIFRRFMPLSKWKEKRNNIYELRFSFYDKIMNVPNLSGCFMFLRTSVLNEVGIFDENFFMYLEDVDLTRRIHQKYQTVFYPRVCIYHAYNKASYKTMKHLLFHIKSAIYYFSKWGWFKDVERDSINATCLAQLKKLS